MKTISRRKFIRAAFSALAVLPVAKILHVAPAHADGKVQLIVDKEGNATLKGATVVVDKNNNATVM